MSSVRTLVGPLLRYTQLRRSQYWSADQRHACTRSRLTQTLATAAAIPFYRDWWGDQTSPVADHLASLPVISRSEIEPLNRSVRSLHAAGTPLIRGCTSGSTGVPAEFLFDRPHEAGRLGSVARHLRENGWNPLRRSAWICAFGLGADSSGPMRRFFPTAHTLPVQTTASDQLDWLERIKPAYLHTLPSNLQMLVATLRAAGAPRRLSFRRIFMGAEVLDDSLREAARELFGAEITDAYGSTEAFLAWQCASGRYHVNAEHVVIEVVDDRHRPVAPGQLGRVLVTTLENHLMPLVRYDIGDYAYATDDGCPCGRTLPVLGAVAGRSVNLFRRPDGSLVSPWAILVGLERGGSNRLAAQLGLRQVQLVQKDTANYVLRYVSDRDPGMPMQSLLERQLRELIGVDVSVVLERVADIPRTATGKFMVARSELASSP